MKLEDITTVEQAKALAFDCIQAIEQQQQNLRALQQRIAQLSEEKPDFNQRPQSEATITRSNIVN